MTHPLEKELFDNVKQNTPEEIKNSPLFDIQNKNAFTFTLTKELVQNLELWDWFHNYKKEALVSTGGIRGPQNVLYPWDTRFPINVLGVALATLGKALVVNEPIKKLAACEVRYNSKTYVEIIARIQAAQQITTYITEGFKTIPIWMASFLIFKYGLYGGEYLTSSHGVSAKQATKYLNKEGSQYMPEESLKFVTKIEHILKTAEEKGYKIQFSEKENKYIDTSFMSSIEHGTNDYAQYLKSGVATETNLSSIRDKRTKLIVDCIGGCMFNTMKIIFDKLNISNTYTWIHTEEDPFFHGIGKYRTNPNTGKKEFFDYGCDVSIKEVMHTLGYASMSKEYPLHTIVMNVDPDGDRLVVGQIEHKKHEARIKELGNEYIDLREHLFVFYSATQAFLMTIDFLAKTLKKEGKWNDHPRFIIKTTASSPSWDEWANAQGVNVLNCPVGFKEIAALLRKIEQQNEEVVITDIFGKVVHLGKEPRLLFAGEESGGMITGPEEQITSKNGQKVLAMREKSAGEAMVIFSALAAHIENEGISLLEYLERVYKENNIHFIYDDRVDLIYYNESNQDPEAIKKEKEFGEIKRDKNDVFFLGVALALREQKITIEQGKELRNEAFPSLTFNDLEDILFVGDGTFFRFQTMVIEIRKSGTDAKTKAYFYGKDKQRGKKIETSFTEYDGTIHKKYEELIGTDFLKSAPKKARDIYEAYLRV
jgi:phosphomannomutase